MNSSSMRRNAHLSRGPVIEGVVRREVALELCDGVEVHLAPRPPARAAAVQGMIIRRLFCGRRRGAALLPLGRNSIDI